MSDGTLALFDAEPYTIEVEPKEAISADRRRTLLQAEKLRLGVHPLSSHERGTIRLHREAAPSADQDAPGRRCGTCRFRQSLPYHTRSYPKCVYDEGDSPEDIRLIGLPRVSHGSASDVRAWWPACDAHTPGDPGMSEDAARWNPDWADEERTHG